MIHRIEALNFRCLRYVNQTLDKFQILVGPNASGKTTFLDVVTFLADIVAKGPEYAVDSRTGNFYDLIWKGIGNSLELAIELKIPEKFRKSDYCFIRYEIEIGINNKDELVLLAEAVILKKKEEIEKTPQRNLFPEEPNSPKKIISPKRIKNGKRIVSKVPGGNDNYNCEVYEGKGGGWAPSFKLGPRKSALGNLPADETRFPATTWLKDMLTFGVQSFTLNSRIIRNPSPPGQGKIFNTDGSNLPWIIENLKNTSQERFSEWIKHVQTALPDINNIIVTERPEDKHKYLSIIYSGGVIVPSWMVSDGTLRLLALTLPAYLTDFSGVYLIEEPENGIHPRAVETVFKSLSSTYDAQILMATHSPIILSLAKPSDVLCFSKTPSGAVDIVLGTKHPSLQRWKGETNLGTLFASGVLG